MSKSIEAVTITLFLSFYKSMMCYDDDQRLRLAVAWKKEDFKEDTELWKQTGTVQLMLAIKLQGVEEMCRTRSIMIG